MRPARRAVLSLWLLAALPATRPARAQEEELAQVMRALAAVRERRDRFTEVKQIPQLEDGLPSEGVLRWSAPDRLEKHTLSPFEERVTVAGPRLLYERPDRNVRRDIALEEQPEMAALVEAVRGTLAGDAAALRRHYEVGFRFERDGSWRMTLTPLSLRLRGAVQRIVVTGEGARLQGVDTEGGGGVTRMRITPGAP